MGKIQKLYEMQPKKDNKKINQQIKMKWKVL